jgi:two-component system sensor histidine kinase YesM
MIEKNWVSPSLLKQYKDFKIKNKIFFVSLSLLFIFSLIGIITFNYFSNLYEKRIYAEAAEVLQITSTILDAEINKIERLSFQTSTNNNIQNSLKSINENKYNYAMFRTKASLIKQLESLAASEKYITSIQIKDMNGITYSAGYKTKIYSEMDDKIKKVRELEGANIWLNLSEENLLTASRLIRDTENLSLTPLGVINITIDIEQAINTSLNFSKHKNFVITSNQEVIYSKDNKVAIDKSFQTNNESGYTIKKINNEDYLVAYSHSRFTNLTYYNLLPFEHITKQTKFYKTLMVFVFLIMLLLTITLSYRAAKGISRPLEELTKKLKAVQSSSFENIGYKSSKHSRDEVDVLSKNFHTMLQKIDNLNKKNYQKQMIIKETEYKALQAQINPHFLYNTLDSIHWLAQVNDQEVISTMTEALGNMMRNIISKKDPLISIREELEIVESYITIQKYRYQHRLEFSMNDTKEFVENSIPKLTIQPILENAIQHALEESIHPCKIKVYFTTFINNLEITVEDDGPGIDEQTIDAIYKNTVQKKGTGIGLYNIIERIRLMFGSEYGIEIDSKVGCGTKIIIRLPITRG